ncbi:unnamed protein product, partial [marine sediment metagenome]
YKRLVKYTNIIVYAQTIYVKNPDGNVVEVDDYKNYTIIDMRRKTDNITQFNLHIKPYYNYYDTDQIIEPLVKIKNVKKGK